MKLVALFATISGLAWGQVSPQIEPEAEKLYRRASIALHQLPAYEMDVETTLERPRGAPGEGFHLLASIAVKQPDRILISGSTPFDGQTTVYSDGHTSLLWQESTNQFATIKAAIPASLLMRLTLLTPESEPVEQTLVSAKILRDEEIVIDGESFACKVIEVSTTGRAGVRADPRPRTLWVDLKTGVALRQQTDVVPPGRDFEVPARIEVTRFHYGDSVDNGDFSFIVPADATEVDWHLQDVALTNRALVGKVAPPLHLATADGRALDLAKFRGKPVLLHFETAWCKPCGESAAVIDSVAKTLGGEVRVVRVSAGESTDLAKGFAMATAADLESLGLKAWPANLVIGRDGKILSFESGRATEAALLALLRNAIATETVQPQVWGPAEPKRHGPKAHEEVTPPELVYKVDPGYTPEAQKAKITGTVMLAILVATDGSVSDIHVLERLDPGLDAKAISAVSKWRFTPAMRDGVPVAFRARAGVSFSQQ